LREIFEVMYRYKSQNPEKYNLPWPGIDKKLHQQGNLFIEMKQGNKNASIVQN